MPRTKHDYSHLGRNLVVVIEHTTLRQNTSFGVIRTDGSGFWIEERGDVIASWNGDGPAEWDLSLSFQEGFTRSFEEGADGSLIPITLNKERHCGEGEFREEGS